MLLDPVTGTLEHYMTLLSTRQKLVASNIANVDTPGYKTKDIDFENELQNATSGLSPAVNEVQGLVLKNDGNNVDLDRESRLLAENALRFNIAANLLHSQLKLTRMAIDGGTAAS